MRTVISVLLRVVSVCECECDRARPGMLFFRVETMYEHVRATGPSSPSSRTYIHTKHVATAVQWWWGYIDSYIVYIRYASSATRVGADYIDLCGRGYVFLSNLSHCTLHCRMTSCNPPGPSRSLNDYVTALSQQSAIC